MKFFAGSVRCGQRGAAAMLVIAALALPSFSAAGADFEVLSYTKNVPGGSLVGDENPFLIDIQLVEDFPPCCNTNYSDGYVELMFRLDVDADIEIRGDLSREYGGASLSDVSLRLTDVTVPESPIDLFDIVHSGHDEACNQILCVYPLVIDESLAAGDYLLVADAHAQGVNVFYPQLGRYILGGSQAYADVSMERFMVPEPSMALSMPPALLTLAWLARRRARILRSQS